MKSIIINSQQREEEEGKVNIESTVNMNGEMSVPEAMLHLATSLQAISQTLGKIAKQMNTVPVEEEKKEA